MDSAHVVVTPGRLTRELLYVSMTRGRLSNTAYVSENDPDVDEILDPSARSNWRTILGEVLAAEGAERTAHEVRDRERSHADSLERLNREYDYLAQIAASADLARSLELLSPGLAVTLRVSPAWGAAVAAWRQATNTNRPGAHRVLSESIGSGPTANDVTAVIHSRLRRYCSAMPHAPIDPMTEQFVVERDDLKETLDQVRRRIGSRTELVARAALLEEPDWETALFDELGAQMDSYAIAALVREVAVYRDHWGIHDSLFPLGTAPAAWEWEQRSQWERLQVAVQKASQPLLEPTAVVGFNEMQTQQSLISTGWQL